MTHPGGTSQATSSVSEKLPCSKSPSWLFPGTTCPPGEPGLEISISERKELSLQEKVRVLEMLEGPKVSQSELAKRFGVSQPQICRIIKNKERILAEWCKNANPGRKRKLEDKAVPGSTALLQWFERSCVPSAPHNGVPLPGRAGHLCEAFGQPELAAGWLGSAGAKQKRPLPEERAEAECWDNTLLPCILSRYDPPDIYACGEAAILFRATPEDLALEKREAGQEQLTVLLCTNMDASDKRDALIVGKAQKLLPFQGAEAQEFLPATYRADSRAWMTAAIFAEWLQKLNEDMKCKRRSVVLFLAQCGAHPYAELSHVKMVFMPPGLSRVHPLEHGAIQSFRCHYRRRLLTRLLVALDGRAPAAPPGQLSGHPTLLDAVHTVVQAWSEVCPRTIQSGFRAAGLGSSPRLPTPPVDVIRALGFQTQEQFEQFALVDEGLECFGEQEGADAGPEDPPAQDLAAEGRRKREDQPLPARPTKADVMESLAQLRRYLECHAVPPSVFQAFYKLEDVVHGLSLADMQGLGLRT
uniref:Tigger transposable element derived 3 n=1 Tax=Varanus komodoensis TaxID=61221 RepID=A0A8D2L316_VARKO